MGGVGGFVLQFLAGRGLLDLGLRVRTLTLPDEFLEQDKPEKLHARAGLDAKGILAQVIAMLPRWDGGVKAAEAR